MTDRTTGAGPQGSRTRVATETAKKLDPVEDKVVRMRHGLSAPDDLVLGQVGENRPDVLARLREIELAALEKSGRLEELRREAGLESPRPEGIKTKIIAGLRQPKARRRSDSHA